jgi:hypothetical protein
MTHHVRRPDATWEVSDEPLVTKTGKVLTDADIEALADEAEFGYEISGGGAGGSESGTATRLRARDGTPGPSSDPPTV